MIKIKNTSLSIKDIDKQVEVFGFVSNKRKMGELIFADLRDESGIVQIVIRNNSKAFSKESVLKVKGKVVKRKDVNNDLKTGEIEIEVTELKVLAISQELPFVIREDLEAKEETRLRHRYLDLRRPNVKKIFKTRHKVIKIMRDFLDSSEFIEIETPLLSKSTPEGARDFLVPTRKFGQFFALPQSPQLYKQLLMASGFEKYFQIARVFRDEDSRKDRQPEFTQLDIELSFSSEEELIKLMENMFVEIMKYKGHNIKTPFNEMDYDFAIENYGSDKPDLRYEYKLIDVKNNFEDTDFNVFKLANSIKMIAFDQLISKKQINVLEEISKKNFAKGLAFVTFEDNKLDGPGAKFFEKESIELFKKHNLRKGTLLFVADEKEVVNQALGAVRVKLNEMFNLASDNYEFVWIKNWPLFEKDSLKGRLIAKHHPFTSPQKDFVDSFDKEPEKAKASAYDLVLNGFELGGGSVRINDIEIQKRMFATIGMEQKEYESQFGFFLEAFKYGLPPHLGIAFGIDRLIMILENTESIRDVIAFPKSSKGLSIMEDSPSEVSEDQLGEYFLNLKK